MLERWEDMVHLEELGLSNEQLNEIRECINYNKIKKEDTDAHQRAKLVQQMMEEEEKKANQEEKASFTFDRARDKIQILKDRVNSDDVDVVLPFEDGDTKDLQSLNLQR